MIGTIVGGEFQVTTIPACLGKTMAAPKESVAINREVKTVLYEID